MQYQSSTGRPLIKDSFCLFIDILGFSHNITEADKNGKQQWHLSRIYSAIENAQKQIKNKHSKSIWTTKLFSDNLLLACPIDDIGRRDAEGHFGAIIYPIKQYQLELVLKGYFVRGGWSVGNLFVDNNMIYGQALIDAYDTESKVAKYACIAISNTLRQLITDKYLSYYANSSDAPFNSDLLVDSDNRLIVNYLTNLMEEQQIDFLSLSKHKISIEAKIRKYKKSPMLDKYEYSAQYHNYFCQTFIQNCPKDCFIDIPYKNLFKRLV